MNPKCRLCSFLFGTVCSIGVIAYESFCFSDACEVRSMGRGVEFIMCSFTSKQHLKVLQEHREKKNNFVNF